jgi:phage terminase small subunit
MHEIQQFYTFFGGAFTLGEIIETEMKVPNGYGGNAFDATVNIWLDSINTDNDSYTMKAVQEVNAEQLKQATFDYLTTLAQSMKVTLPALNEIPDMKNEVRASAYIHDLGWTIYTSERKEVTAEGRTNVAETIIELQE